MPTDIGAKPAQLVLSDCFVATAFGLLTFATGVGRELPLRAAFAIARAVA
jgi:hypothetical protein